MQPIYLRGHERPVRKVLYNNDGDLLFTCSDDKTINCYRTSDCMCVGVYHTKDACKSIDVTTDSKYVIAANTTQGYQIFETSTGKQLVSAKVPGFQTKNVEFNFSDT